MLSVAGRYEGEGMFMPHYDYGYKESTMSTTIQTFMLYLDAPTDADTVVYTEGQEHYATPEPENELARVVPQPGMALVFNPWITHGGAPVKVNEEKHILRTELMYHLQD